MRDKHSCLLPGVCCFVLLEIDPIALMVRLVGLMDPGGGHSLQQTCTLIYSHNISSISRNVCTLILQTLCQFVRTGAWFVGTAGVPVGRAVQLGLENHLCHSAEEDTNPRTQCEYNTVRSAVCM